MSRSGPKLAVPRAVAQPGAFHLFTSDQTGSGSRWERLMRAAKKAVDHGAASVYIVTSHPLRADRAVRSAVPFSHIQHHTLSGLHSVVQGMFAGMGSLGAGFPITQPVSPMRF